MIFLQAFHNRLWLINLLIANYYIKKTFKFPDSSFSDVNILVFFLYILYNSIKQDICFHTSTSS